MNLKLVNINEKDQLNDFIKSNADNQFLQSWEWGEILNCDNKIFRLGVVLDNKLLAAITIVKKTLPLSKNYFYAPRGPIFNCKCQITNYELVWKFLFEGIVKLSKKEKVIFFRFEPLLDIKFLKSEFKIKKSTDMQPSKSLILDLSKTEEDLLAQMHQKTRYNIRLAAKKGVKIIKADLNKFDKFWSILNKTGLRDGFRLHKKEHYKKILEELNNSHKNNFYTRLFFAMYKNKVIAASIVGFFGDTVTYIHGASANHDRNVMAPYLLQWEIIKIAKSLGYKKYDFFGIDEQKWPGVTRFKKGFSGKEVNYPGTFDLIIGEKWYYIYSLIRTIKK